MTEPKDPDHQDRHAEQVDSRAIYDANEAVRKVAEEADLPIEQYDWRSERARLMREGVGSPAEPVATPEESAQQRVDRLASDELAVQRSKTRIDVEDNPFKRPQNVQHDVQRKS
jgi:hypothetical protein